MTGVLELRILDNSTRDWALALLIFLLVYVSYGIAKRYLLRHLPRLERLPDRQLNRLVQDLLGRTKTFLVFFLALYLASLALTLPPEAENFLRVLTVVSLIIQSAFWGMGVVDYLIQRRIQAETEDEQTAATTMGAVGLVSKIALWSIAILLILENVTGLEMNTLITTLGITGVAVALAVQNILGDLFSSISIALDKPFVIGDAIVVGNFSGTVEHIGLKSTRLRSVSGEQLVFSNSDLLNSRIQNFKRMERRRVLLTLGISPQTPYEKLAAIPSMLQEIIESHEKVTFDRVHFKEFGINSLNFECAYFVETSDFIYHMDTLHAINLEIYRRFKEKSIDLYPAQAIIVEK